MAGPRIVMHLDMDAFFAAIEQRERPELRGQPVLIGHPGRRGVVATCSYEARRFGIHSAMPSVTALRLCPDGIWVAPRGRLYREVSRRIFTRLEERVPVLERVSVDEAYAELTGVVPDFVAAAAFAREVKDEIEAHEALRASVGLGACRFVAKIASDLEKPDGLTVVPPEDFARRMHPLPVGKIPGVGPKLGSRLAARGLRTIGDLAKAEPRALRREFGPGTGLFLAQRAQGEDDSRIGGEHARQQISEERTYGEDLSSEDEIRAELRARAEGVAEALRKRGLCGRTVVLKARDGRYNTVTRSHTLPEPTDIAAELYEAALTLWKQRVDFGGAGVRLLGLGASGLIERASLPLPLFPDEKRERRRSVDRAADEVRRRFGDDTIGPGSLLRR